MTSKRERSDGVKNFERVREIRAKLEKHCLTVQWLVGRLYADEGLEVNRSGLSHILSGERISGEQTERVITACECVINKYEAAFS